MKQNKKQQLQEQVKTLEGILLTRQANFNCKEELMDVNVAPSVISKNLKELAEK